MSINTIDFEVNGKCNLNCPWCWGPEHTVKGALDVENWKSIVDRLPQTVKNIVITGGETLLKPGIIELAKYIKSKGLRVTLSTNGILLTDERFVGILEYVDDLGLPLDGPTVESNTVMRPGVGKHKSIHFDSIINTIKFVQTSHPNIAITIRTVVSGKNINYVKGIPEFLIKNGINIADLRWKLYQVNPVGPRADVVVNEGWMISVEEFDQLITDINSEANKFKNLVTQRIEDTAGRYIIISPDGDIRAYARVDDQNQSELLGNALDANFSYDNIDPNFLSGNIDRYIHSEG
jgi:MoaA/NifB/PqqE/SkfB family radical SAM enzyme